MMYTIDKEVTNLNLKHRELKIILKGSSCINVFMNSKVHGRSTLGRNVRIPHLSTLKNLLGEIVI